MNQERSLRDLRIEAERNRADFTETVSELRSKVSDSVTQIRDRLSPEAIKAEAADYVRSRGEMLIDKARANPLQAAAIGASLAYPLLGIVRSIPAPVLMIGAGLFFLGSGAGQNAGRKASEIANDLSDQIAAGGDVARRTLHDAQDQVVGGIASAKDSAAAGLDAIAKRTTAGRAAFADGADHLREKAAILSDSVSTGLSSVRQTVQSAPSAMRDGLASATAAIQDSATRASDLGSDAAGKLRDQTLDVSQQSAAALKRVIQQNPLLIASLGVVVGAIIASALPRSDMETGVIGGASAELKKRVNDAAVQGLDTVKEIASTVVAEASREAGRQGLGASDLQSAAEDLGGRIRKVAENATTTAFELSTQDPHTGGERSVS
jgi:hypothetical protein